MVVIADYRKYPQVKFPAFVKDGAKALAWVADHIDSYGGDVKHIYVAGHSAGAHIAALIVSDPRYLAAYGKNRRVVKAFAGLAGPYDFVPDTDDLKAIFAPPNRYSQMQVSTFIDGKQPPTLLLWGADDKVVGKPNLDKLAAAIHKKGGCVKTKIYPDVDHVWLVGELSWAGDDKANVLQDMEEYFEQPQCS